MLLSAFVIITTASAYECGGGGGFFGLFGQICVGECEPVVLNDTKDVATITKIMRSTPPEAPFYKFRFDSDLRHQSNFYHLRKAGTIVKRPECVATYLSGCSCVFDWDDDWSWFPNPIEDAPRCGMTDHLRRLNDDSCEEFANKKPTAQSSTWAGVRSSTLAVDGRTNRNGDYCSHTLHKANTGRNNEWWRVDLQDVVAITSVEILNRDSFKERINGATIMVGMEADVGRATPCATIDSISTSKVFACVDTGRYVFIVGAPGQYLTLCEVKVWGTSMQDAPVKPSACALVAGGMWQHVRHVPAGKQWHYARDSLKGTHAYGRAYDDDDSWSVTWEDSKVSEFMFATGDCEKWLVASRDAVVGKYYTNEPREILQSSTSNTPYYARWYRRPGALAEPWISLEDYHTAVNNGNILYGADARGGTRATNVLPHHQGADVYIRTNVELARGKPTAQSTTGWDGFSSYAVDGNTHTNCDSAGCAHTVDGFTGVKNEWWRVDLEVTSYIDTVQIWNRDILGYRINGATIKVGDSSNHRYADACATIDSIPQGGNKVFTCTGAGRYVFIVAVPGQYVTLPEVKVFGTTQDEADIQRWMRAHELRRLEAEEGSVLKRLAAGETEVTSDATTDQLP